MRDPLLNSWTPLQMRVMVRGSKRKEAVASLDGVGKARCTACGGMGTMSTISAGATAAARNEINTSTRRNGKTVAGAG